MRQIEREKVGLLGRWLTLALHYPRCCGELWILSGYTEDCIPRGDNPVLRFATSNPFPGVLL